MIAASEVAATTNKVHDLVIQAEGHPSRFECKRLRAEALNRSCRFMTSLTASRNDEYLAKNYAAVLVRAENENLGIGHSQRETPNALIDLILESRHQFEFFLKLEYGLLVDSGVDSSFAQWLVDTIRDSIEEIRSRSASPGDLFEALGMLQRHVCTQSKDILASVGREYWHRTLLGSFGGISIVTVNLAATGLLSPLAIGASAAIGTAFLGQSARRMLDG